MTAPPLSPPPRQVLLFSGHRLDAPGRAAPRFPPSKEPVAAAAIDEALQRLAAGPEDLALTQGAAGGDLLFAEACLRRGLRLALLQPLPEPQFIDQSVASSPDGERWRERYRRVASQAAWPPHAWPGDDAATDPFTGCNRWLVDTALSFGTARMHLVCLWDGGDGDGPGGTAQMVDEVARRGGRVTWVDTRTLW